MVKSVVQAWQLVRQMLLLMVGVPDYAAYRHHRQRHAPHARLMSRDQFIRYCAVRRLGGHRPGGCC